jgi:hypothetical protein
MNMEVELWPRNSFSGNIGFKFSVLCLCNVASECSIGTASCIAHGGSVQQPDAIAGFITQSRIKNIKILSYMHRNIETVKKYGAAESYTRTVFGFCEELTTLFYEIFAKVWVCAGIL